MTKLKLFGAILLLIAILGAEIASQKHRLMLAREHATTLALNASNTEARHDTTHDLAIENSAVARLLNDSLRLFERRAVQVRQQRDSLDLALGRERVAMYSMRVALDSLRRDNLAPTRVDSTPRSRVLSFHIRQEPLTIDARVDIPPLIDDTRLSLRATVDTLSVVARVTCGKPDADGVRNAYISTTTVTWATVRFANVQQDPAVCSLPPPVDPAAHRRPLRWIPLALGVGRSLGDGKWTVFLGAGVGF